MVNLNLSGNVSLVVLILILGATLFTTACGTAAEDVAAAPPDGSGREVSAAADTGIPVEVAPVKPGNISLMLQYAGNLQAQKDVNVVPQANGKIEQLLVEVGDQVQAGEPIAIIAADIYKVQLKQAQTTLTSAELNLEKMELGTRPEELGAAYSALALARAQLADTEQIDDNERTSAAAALANAQAALRQAQAEYDKIAWAGQVGETPQALQLEQATIAYEQALAGYNLQTNPSDSQLAPLESQVVQAELQLALTEEPYRPIDFEIARTNIAQAQSALELAQLQLEYTTIEAPFDGMVAELYIEEGDMVGQAAVALVVSNEMEVAVNVEESRLGQVEKGQHVALRVSTYPGEEFPAVVTNVAPIADAKTHTFVVTVTPLDEEGLLRSGMYADVTLLAEEKENTLLAPVTAITTVNGQPTVYVINDENIAEQRDVTTGLSNKSQVEILSGIKAGEKVVVDGQVNLTDGTQVNVIPEL